MADVNDARERIGRILGTLPEVLVETAGEGDRHLGASVRGKRFAWFHDDHHGDGRLAVVFKAPPGANVAMVRSDPEHFFLPSYSGPKGWLGSWLDVDGIDWDHVELSLVEAYRMTAPKSLAARLDPS